MAYTIDTLGIFDTLKKTFSEEQAHNLSDVLKDIQEEGLQILATKQDLREMELRLKHDLLVRFGAMQAVSVAVITAMVKLL